MVHQASALEQLRSVRPAPTALYTALLHVLLCTACQHTQCALFVTLHGLLDPIYPLGLGVDWIPPIHNDTSLPLEGLEGSSVWNGEPETGESQVNGRRKHSSCLCRHCVCK